MKGVKSISFLGVIAMTAVLFYGFTAGNFFEDGGRLLENPWGIVSLVDLYTGFALFAVWIYFRESSLVAKVLWIVALMVLGFFTASLYVLLQAVSSRGDLLKFAFGAKKKKVMENYVK